MLDFKPPKPRTTAIQVGKALMPLINRLYLKGLTLDIDTESIARLETTDGHPTVLAPNHAAHADPAVMFLLSKRVIRSSTIIWLAREDLRHREIRGYYAAFSAAVGAVRFRLCVAPQIETPFRTTREILSKGDRTHRYLRRG